MPISITFFAGQGEEPTLIKIGTAYESATHHRFAPPAFGPVPPRAPVGFVSLNRKPLSRLGAKPRTRKSVAAAGDTAATRVSFLSQR